ncbi:MAG: twin-arginine translocation signal domain-containing protein, partial [Rhodobacteraceae bacterium]|nr:twin-arginine translocation signal domain-containing protein [Paracoccaceae bacterium]
MKYDISRRGALKAGGALVAASAIAPQLLQAQPSRGGDLRVGAGGANTSDSWDARTHSDLFMQMACMGS